MTINIALFLTLAFILGAFVGTILFTIFYKVSHMCPNFRVVWWLLDIYMSFLISTYFIINKSPLFMLSFMFGIGLTQVTLLATDVSNSATPFVCLETKQAHN